MACAEDATVKAKATAINLIIAFLPLVLEEGIAIRVRRGFH
jgi:hypothetical protein